MQLYLFVLIFSGNLSWKMQTGAESFTNFNCYPLKRKQTTTFTVNQFRVEAIFIIGRIFVFSLSVGQCGESCASAELLTRCHAATSAALCGWRTARHNN